MGDILIQTQQIVNTLGKHCYQDLPSFEHSQGYRISRCPRGCGWVQLGGSHIGQLALLSEAPKMYLSQVLQSGQVPFSLLTDPTMFHKEEVQLFSQGSACSLPSSWLQTMAVTACLTHVASLVVISDSEWSEIQAKAGEMKQKMNRSETERNAAPPPCWMRGHVLWSCLFFLVKIIV